MCVSLQYLPVFCGMSNTLSSCVFTWRYVAVYKIICACLYLSLFCGMSGSLFMFLPFVAVCQIHGVCMYLTV